MSQDVASMDNRGLIFILGGARSGKSVFAESLAGSCAKPVYIATAQSRDADSEMRARIEAHKKRRGAHWISVEEPLELAAAIVRFSRPQEVVLVDCLTLWLSNLLHAGRDIEAEVSALLASLQTVSGSVILVSNEVGLGIVPANRLAREFRDHAGRLHQAVAAAAQRVYFVVSGIPLSVKDER